MNMQQQSQQSSQPQDLLKRYQRAQALEQGIFTKSIVRNPSVAANWVGEGKHFWYEKHSEAAMEFRLVDGQARSSQPAFDHALFAKALAEASGEAVDADNLPIAELELSLEPLSLRFVAFETQWTYSAASGLCEKIAKREAHWVVSPDGKLAAFKRDYNLWLCDIATGKERPLTEDGEHDNAYGNGPTAWGCNFAPGLQALWSPDSKQLLAVQMDMRQVLSSPVLHHVSDDGNRRPAVMEYKSAHPGDEHIELYRLLTIDVGSGDIQRADFRGIPPCREALGFFDEAMAWWSGDSNRAYFIAPQRGEKVFEVVELDCASGATRVLFEETSDTYVKLEPSIVVNPPVYWHLPTSDELVWWSERNGWGQLYLYDLKTGALKKAITQGDTWLVRNILACDTDKRELLIQTAGRVAGRDPYYRDLCRVNLDTGELREVAAGDCDFHCAGTANASGQLVVTRGRVDQVSETVLLDSDGRELMTVETTDLSGLPEGFEWPEPVAMKSADGVTDIYGVMFRPANFSPDQSYPVVDYCYNAPYHAMAPKTAMIDWDGPKYLVPAALAQLGFIVVVIDGRGTALRSKAFQDEGYGWVPSCSHLDDHVAGIRQLGERYRFMDLDRVGITSFGYSSGVPFGLMQYPDFFKVGAVYGLEDSRFMTSVWGEKYEGLSGPEAGHVYTEELVEKLEGKLLLAHGLLDRCVPPGGILNLVDALQAANKDFDMLLLPKAGHPAPSYVIRRMWDYLVTHLLGEVPPKEFHFTSTQEPMMLAGYFQEELELVR